MAAITSATAMVPKSAGKPGLTADMNEPIGLFLSAALFDLGNVRVNLAVCRIACQQPK